MYKATAKVYIWDKADIRLALYSFSVVYTLISVYYRGDISRGRSISRYQDSSYFTRHHGRRIFCQGRSIFFIIVPVQ